MKYGIKTTARFKYPYIEGAGKASLKLSHQARVRLSWMDYIQEGNSIRKTSRYFGIPESTIRYWRRRYNKWRLPSLENRSKKPHSVRESSILFSTIEQIVELRQKYGWGKVKLQVLLRRIGIKVGQSRIQKVINKAGLKRIKQGRINKLRRNRRHMYSVPAKVIKQPGGLVYLDVKHLRLIKYSPKVYRFTAIDHATRMLRVKLFSRITSRCGKLFLNYLEKYYPFDRIQYIGSDNGSEFLGDLEKELEKKGIIHVFSTPRSPKQNPFVERVIQTTVYRRRGTEATIERQQQVLDDYVKIYNEVRPHESLAMRTPIEQFNLLRNSLAPNAQHVPNQNTVFRSVSFEV
jgi:transposase InsO family protein